MNHINELMIWCKEVRLKSFIGSSKEFKKSYIELDTYLTPRSSQTSICEGERKVKLISAIDATEKHCVILGGSGAGKTTSMKKLCLSVLENEGTSKYSFVARILLRNVDFKGSLTPIKDTLSDLICFHFERDESFEREMSDIALAKAYAALLDSLQCLIVIDGFDEVVEEYSKEAVLKEFKFYCSQMSKTKLVLTSRTGEIKSDIPNAIFYEISKLDEGQIIEFAEKNLGERSDGFLESIKTSPYFDTAVRPLLLAQLASIYEKTGYIPEKPQNIYRMITNLLINEWDIDNSIIRLSDFSNFEKDNKEDFLTNLAFNLTCEGIRGEFSFSVFEKVCSQLHVKFKFPNERSSIAKIADELESHTGILFKCRVNNYEFAHRSIQEYLTALYISKLPSTKSLLSKIGDHRQILNLGPELAIATAMSSEPLEYFSDLFLEFPKILKLNRSFVDKYIERLIDESPAVTGRTENFSLAVFSILNNGVTEDNLGRKFYHFIEPALQHEGLSVIGDYYEIDYDYHGEDLKLKLVNPHLIYDIPVVLKVSYAHKRIRDVVSEASKKRKKRARDLYNN
jgi:predicted NACHT family NTPase